MLLPWIAAARQAGWQLKLIVRGAFAKETPGYQQEITEQISVLGLSDHVVLGGFVSDPDKVMLELMSCACPLSPLTRYREQSWRQWDEDWLWLPLPLEELLK